MWFITYSGTKKSLAQWGISDAVLRRRNFEVGRLEFSLALADVGAAPPFSKNASLVLSRDNTIRFIGTVAQIRTFASSREVRRRYVVNDAFWQLSRITYQQPYIVKSGDFTTLTGSMSTRVVLGQDAWGRKITTDAQILSIALYALTQGAGVFTLAAIAEPFTTPPLSETRDISCLEAIRRMAAWTPDCVAYMDYSSGAPILRILRRSQLSAVQLDLDAGDVIEGLESLNSREDLVPAGVVITFVTQEVSTVDGELSIRETRQTAGAGAGVGVIFATVDLANQGSDQAEQVPPTLAADYYASINVLHWEGTLQLHERECSGQVQLGHRLNLANGDPAWASMNAMVQGVTEELDRGVTTIETGPPDRLGVSDFLAMQNQFRMRQPATAFADSQHNSTEGIDLEEGEEAGITGFGPAPDVAPAAREPNPRAGNTPTQIGGVLFASKDLELCDGSSVRLLGFSI